MANSKNTIQNIPLTGPLCLNTLKTDVAQFEGYNEKNTTVFGGELTPLWKKESEIDSEENSYTIYNSKGHSFTIKRNNYVFGLWDNQKNKWITDSSHAAWEGKYLCPVTVKLDLPSDALWGGMFIPTSRELMEVYISSSGSIYYRKIALGHEEGDTYAYWADKELDKAINNVPWIELEKFYNSGSLNLVAVTGDVIYTSLYGESTLRLSFLYTHLGRQLYFHGGFYKNTPEALVPKSESSIINKLITPDGTLMEGNIGDAFLLTAGRSRLGSTYKVSIVVVNKGNGNVGRFTSNDTVDFYGIDYNLGNSIGDDNVGWGELYTANKYYPMYYYGSWTTDDYVNLELYSSMQEHDTVGTFSFSPYVVNKCSWATDINGPAWFCRETGTYGSENMQWYRTGHDGHGFIPGIMASSESPTDSEQINDKDYQFRFYTRGNNLTAITFGGIHISAPTSFSDNYVTISSPSDANAYGLNYKSGNDRYFFVAADPNVLKMFNPDKDFLSTMLKEHLIIDNRYILMLNTSKRYTFMFDIEKESIVATGGELGYVSTMVPEGNLTNQQTTGCMYASGFNAGYEIKGGNFVGYLANPEVMTFYPPQYYSKYTDFLEYTVLAKYQTYFSVGDNVQSAEYFGTDTELAGTKYPIDTNGNIILPLALNNKIVSGFSNNDMIILNGTAYPIMYYNNNQKLYNYQLLSGIDNVEGMFSLQGQRYFFDENCIYTANYGDGVVNNIQPVCYKKSLVYLGSLPKAAIFYSFYNKTFYQFTGDAIVSKMFEANDINKIHSVAQNPATLSLWICTDSGVYILSDNDMFKLVYNSRNVFFYENRTNIISTDETGKTSSNVISLYKLEDDQSEQPIKLHTKFYGIGAEQKVTYDCWYIRLHNKDHKAGKLKLKVNTITNTSFETEEKTYDIEPSMYDGNDTIFIRYQPKYQSAVATQLELESDIAIYQISLGVNTTDAVAQQSKFSF